MTIDGTRPDNALENSTKTFPAARSHFSTQQGVDNLEPPSAIRRVIGVVGHGIPGVTFTGGRAEFISIANGGAWEGELHRLRGRAQLIILVSCDTGKGREGRELLQRVSCASGMTAAAPTKAVHVRVDGKMWVHRGGEWQYMTCQGTNWRLPTGLFASIRHRFFGPGPQAHVAALEFGEVVEARFTLPPETRRDVRVFEGLDALELVASIERIPEEVPSDSAPLSFQTGHLEVMSVRDGQMEKHRYEVYGGSLLRDEDNPELFYETDEAFLDKLGGWKAVIAPLLESAEQTEPA